MEPRVEFQLFRLGRGRQLALVKSSYARPQALPDPEDAIGLPNRGLYARLALLRRLESEPFVGEPQRFGSGNIRELETVRQQQIIKAHMVRPSPRYHTRYLDPGTDRQEFGRESRARQWPGRIRLDFPDLAHLGTGGDPESKTRVGIAPEYIGHLTLELHHLTGVEQGLGIGSMMCRGADGENG